MIDSTFIERLSTGDGQLRRIDSKFAKDSGMQHFQTELTFTVDTGLVAPVSVELITPESSMGIRINDKRTLLEEINRVEGLSVSPFSVSQREKDVSVFKLLEDLAKRGVKEPSLLMYTEVVRCFIFNGVPVFTFPYGHNNVKPLKDLIQSIHPNGDNGGIVLPITNKVPDSILFPNTEITFAEGDGANSQNRVMQHAFIADTGTRCIVGAKDLGRDVKFASSVELALRAQGRKLFNRREWKAGAIKELAERWGGAAPDISDIAL
ncbi:hypothetical protein IT417_03505 [bacterium]|nr:hypothetical protein [bacterium]